MTPKQYRALLNMPIQEQERTAKKDFMKSYRKRFLKPREESDCKTATRIYLSASLYKQLKFITENVFGGKITPSTFITNILTDHIEQYSGFFDDVYKPAKTWRQ